MINLTWMTSEGVVKNENQIKIHSYYFLDVLCLLCSKGDQSDLITLLGPKIKFNT